ncbi:flavodoxin [Clostridium oryzae]|uniref:Flavodoxin n=1 Tax=Clostridium oryzae TaxID=1450648 RepID=A0A1V4ILT0_9CLOT|nr:flavodoxin [Clostridium oryzae]OPJ60853.1 flavodoxin [Clostridium oryzae]
MKKISVIYWTQWGNVEALADAVAKGAKGAGAEVNIEQVSDANFREVKDCDAIAFGSPSMDNNQIEQQEMEPFVDKFKLLPNDGKPIVLFGSYGWDEGKFIRDWEAKMKDFGFNVVGKLAVKETPTEQQLEEAKKLGKLLVDSI